LGEKRRAIGIMKKWIIFLWIIFSFVHLINPGALLGSEGKGDLEVTVKGVDLNPTGESSLVVLVDLNDETALPIVIGFPEARAIGLKINDIKTIRPMTHDLLNTVLGRLKAKLIRVVINKVEGDIIYSILYLKLRGSEIQIDSRPSDAIALALRAGAPIFVSREVLKAVGVELGESARRNRLIMKQGLTVQKITPPLAKYFGLKGSEGVLVSDIKPGTPAEGAGLRTGDVIMEVNGRRIKSLRGFESIVQDIEKGKRVKLLVRRGTNSIPLVMYP
jgi:bifunctional DNase/RNase